MPNHTHGLMDTMISSAASSTYTAGNCSCTCSACGGLECLCRPRFFPGQLLTEEDLNRLDHYIVAKNKLHNRYLFGTGVVCGLEVVCHPCEGIVTVKSGYALSPCGDDIVVCKDVQVNICDLINKCRDKERTPDDCEPFGSHVGDDQCKEATQKWMLAICYDEKPSRGMAALRAETQAPCCSRCSCGGSSACGCSCHENISGMKKNGCAPLSKRTPAQCEPTILCEGYKFVVLKTPPSRVKQQKSASSFPPYMESLDDYPFWQQLSSCLGELVKAGLFSLTPPQGVTPQAMRDWWCAIRGRILDALANHPWQHCEALQALEVLCPDPQPNQSAAEYWNDLNNKLAPLIQQLAFDCFCSAFLPPCPPPVTTNCVVLATISSRNHPCKIIDICNFGGRQFVMTSPNIMYWLSAFLPGDMLSKLFTAWCCRDQRDFDFKNYMFSKM